MEVVQLDDPLEAGLQVAILFEHPLIHEPASNAVLRAPRAQTLAALAPAASLVLLRGRERMGRTDWEEA